MSEKIFVLGIGAPKSGTTWLYSYLASMPGFARGFQKEFHIWDAIFIPESRRFLVPEGKPIFSPQQLLRREMQRHPDAYFVYFMNLLSKPGATHTADITPSYCGLSAEQLRFIHQGVKLAGMSIRVVFLMRDPVERCWSMLRMIRNDEKLRRIHSYLDFRESEDRLLSKYALSSNARVRTNYHLTLEALKNSGIPLDQIHVGIYEEMFQTEKLRSLMNFLNLPYLAEKAEEKVHVSPRKQEVEIATRMKVAQHFTPVYRGVAEFHPKVLDLWSGFQFLEDDEVPHSNAVQ